MDESGSFGKVAILGRRTGPLNIGAMNIYTRSSSVGDRFKDLEQHLPPTTAVVQHSRRLSAREVFDKMAERFLSYRRIGSQNRA